MRAAAAVLLSAASALASYLPVAAPWAVASSATRVLPEGPLAWRFGSPAPSPAPPAPHWPPEWSAELTQLNTTSNASAAFASAFSVGRNAARNEFHVPAPNVFVKLQLFDLHLDATLSGAFGASCDEAYLPGSLTAPDVQNFEFQGAGTFGGDTPIWVWVRAPLAYATEQTAQQMPVAILNGDTHIVTAWGPTTVYTNESWPAHFWDKPQSCK